MQQLWEWTQWADANRDGGTAIATNGVVEIATPILQTNGPAEVGMALVPNNSTNARQGPVTNDSLMAVGDTTGQESVENEEQMLMQEAGTPLNATNARVAAAAPPTVEGVMYTPLPWTVDDIYQSDLLIQANMLVDQMLIRVYGDTIHQNYGMHLEGGIWIDEDRFWQCLHHRMASCNLALYDLPAGCWAIFIHPNGSLG